MSSMVDDSSSYPKKVWCANCETMRDIQIPRGVIATPDYIFNTACSFCGNKTLLGFK